MRRSFAILLLSLTAFLLLAANLYVRWNRPPVELAKTPWRETSSSRAGASPRSLAEKPPAATPAPASKSPAFNWAPVESSDYNIYIANLRLLGFPEELIREIVITDVNKLYAPRETACRPKPVPHDAPFSQRRRNPVPEDIDCLIQLREVQTEKQAVLTELLGIRVPREMLRLPNSRNYEGYEYAVSLLPAEKQEAVQLLQENLWITDDMNQAQHWDRNTELEAYRLASEERDAALKQILTPEEFEKYEMNSTPTGTELARRTIGMEPTEAEMMAMYKVTDEYWAQTGGVHGRWRAVSVPPDQIVAADEQLKMDLEQALGQERYIDYQMAISDTGQRMKSLASRYDLPRETLTAAFSLQTEADQVAGTIRMIARYGIPAPSPPPEQSRLSELQSALEQTLGPIASQAWNDGRRQKYELQP